MRKMECTDKNWKLKSAKTAAWQIAGINQALAASKWVSLHHRIKTDIGKSCLCLGLIILQE